MQAVPAGLVNPPTFATPAISIEIAWGVSRIRYHEIQSPTFTGVYPLLLLPPLLVLVCWCDGAALNSAAECWVLQAFHTLSPTPDRSDYFPFEFRGGWRTVAVGNPPPQPPPPDQQRQREDKVASAAPPAPPKLAAATRATPASGAAAAAAAATGAAGLVPVAGVAEGGHGNQQPRRTSSGGPEESGGRDQHDPCRGNASSLVSGGGNACSLAKPTGGATPVDGGVVRDDDRGREDDRVVEGRGSAEDSGGEGGDKAAAVAARNAAVTAEVDARSKIKRFSGGLEGGAGADGGTEGANFECEHLCRIRFGRTSPLSCEIP